MKIKDIIAEDYHEDNYDTDGQYEYHSIAKPNIPGATPVSKVEEIVNIIQHNCSEILGPYLKSGNVLFRGVKATSPVIITNIRPKRIPIQMNPLAHEALSAAFTKLGLTANRENSIFCSGRAHIAGDWGSNVYVIFPKNGWSGTVFQSITDDYSFYALESAAKNYVYNHKDMGTLIARLKEFEPLNVTPQNISGVLGEEYADIIITGSSYIGVDPYKPVGKKVMMQLGFSEHQFY